MTRTSRLRSVLFSSPRFDSAPRISAPIERMPKMSPSNYWRAQTKLAFSPVMRQTNDTKHGGQILIRHSKPTGEGALLQPGSHSHRPIPIT